MHASEHAHAHMYTCMHVYRGLDVEDQDRGEADVFGIDSIHHRPSLERELCVDDDEAWEYATVKRLSGYTVHEWDR